MTRRAETVEGGEDPLPLAPPAHVMTRRHRRICLAGGALALLSPIWLSGVQFIANKTSSSALGAGFATMAIGWWPAIVIWWIGFALCMIGLLLTLRHRLRVVVPVMATVVCAFTFAWLHWPSTEDLVYAAIKNDTTRVNRYLWLGVDVNRARQIRGGFGPPDSWKEAETALTAAVVYGHTEMVRLLLDHGAEINRADGDGRTPLVTAVRSGRPEIIELLIARGATLSVRDPESSKALLHELGRSWQSFHPARLSQTVEILLRHDANLEPVEIHDWAMQRWEPALARRLAAARQERAHPVNPRTDLRNQIALGDDVRAAALLRDLAEQLPEEQWHTERYQILNYAARFNCPKVITLLQDHLPAPVPKKTDRSPSVTGTHALHLAAIEGHLEIVRMLLDWGVPVDCLEPGTGPRTPLSNAVWGGHIDVARELIKRGADVNSGFRPPQAFDTPIFLAAKRGDKPMVELLLEAGARVDIHGHNGRTPLDAAADAGQVALVSLLLDYGAFSGQSTFEGRQTMEQAGLSSEEIVKLTKRPAP